MYYDVRLLHLIGSMDPATGGPCQGIRNSCAVLEKFDVYREVVCFDSPDADYLGMDPFPVYALGKGRSSWQYNSALIPWLRENLHRFDVVITNGLWIYHSNAVRRVLAEMKQAGAQNGSDKMASIRWFIMPHGMLDPYFQRAVDRRLKAVRNWIYWKLLEHKVVEQANGVLFTCETEQLLARETFKPYRPQREINVGYGIEAPPDYTEAMQQAFLEKCPDVAGAPFVLFLSRIHPKKGVDLLLKAYMKVTKQAANSGILVPKLVIAGPGIDSDYGRSITQLAQQDPAIWSNICFTGMLMGDAKWGAFYGCDAFILPSHQENFGIAVAEALACGKPVLISNQVNIWREIESGGGGFVEDNTLAGTQQMFQRWVSLAVAERKIMSESAKATFNQHFAVEPAALRFKEAISS